MEKKIDRAGPLSAAGGATSLFTGTHAMRLDAKGRLTVPSRYRDLLGPEAVAACGFDGCLELWRVEAFDRLAATLLALPYDDPAARARVRRAFGSASRGAFDSLGRLLLPRALLAHAGLARDALVVGVGDRAEVWAPERFPAWDGAGRSRPEAREAPRT